MDDPTDDLPFELLNQKYELVDPATLIPHPDNYNEGDVGVVHESVSANGWYGALIVQMSTRHVLIGNHRLIVVQQAGSPLVPVIWVDVDDVRALRILAVDNRSTRRGHDRRDAVIDVLTSLAMTNEGLTGTGYDGDDLDAMLADQAHEDEPKPPKPKSHNISVRCATAEEQQRVLTQLLSMGLDAQVR